MQNFNETLTKTFSFFFIKFIITLQISFSISSQTFVSNSFVLFATCFAISINRILFATFLAISKKSILSKFSRISKLIFRFSIFTSKRFYLIINNLFVLFNEKSRFSNLLHYQNNVFFSSIKRFNNLVFFISQMRMFIIFQTRITLYFKSIISRVQISNNDQKKHEIKA